MIDPDGKNGRLVGIATEEIAIEVAMQAATGQPIDLVKAAKSAGEATINPLKKIERVAEVAKAAATCYSKAQRMERHKAVDGKCEYCGKQTQTKNPFKSDSAEGDHIKAQSKGGETSADNQANACRECNQNKSAKELGTEWQPPKPNDRIQEIINRNNQAK